MNSQPGYSRTSTSSSLGFGDLPQPPRPQRRSTFPFENTTRRKPRRWPLALRFVKGSIHSEIVIPVGLHALFASLVVVLDQHLALALGLPPSIIPSLSIVVGLMLVFRNQTAYARFWDGRMYLSTIITSCRNLSRCFLTSSYNDSQQTPLPAHERQAQRADTERNVRYLIAMLVSVKNHLRGNWGGFKGIGSRAPSPPPQEEGVQRAETSDTTKKNKKAAKGYNFLRHRGRWRRLRSGRQSEMADLVPGGLVGYEDRGLGVPLQFAALIEGYIKRGHARGWWNAPMSSQYTAQLNTLVDAYSRMETIRLTPVPVALLIHQKQVLGLFGAVLPFAMVTSLGWWAMPISTLVVFTLYGIDGIASQLEDPFGYDRADIDMDALVEDIRTEILALVDEWNRVGELDGEMVSQEAYDSADAFDGVADEATDTSRLTHSAVSRTSIPEEGVAAADWQAGSLLASGTTAAATSAAASKFLPRDAGAPPSASAPASVHASAHASGTQTPLLKQPRRDEGGEWFMPGQGLGKSLSWGSRRYTDAEDA